MESHYIIESEIAVIFLSVTLCVYLELIYSGSTSDKKGLLRYCYMTTASSIVDVFVSVILAKDSTWSITSKYYCMLVWQMASCGVYFMFMRYIAGFSTDKTIGKKRMLYAQNIVLGIFFYLMLVGHFTGANYAINNGELVPGVLSWFISYGFPAVWAVWTWVEIYIYSKNFSRGQLWALFANFAVCWVIQIAQINFFPDIPVNFIIISVNVYYFFFLLETPAYRDLERTLKRLRKAKEIADEANAAAIAADAAKGEFLANMSHEIRTPLTTILGMDEVILRKYESGPIYEYARDIQSAGNTLLHIINDILDFSKIESGQLELSSRNYDLARVLRDVDNMIRIRAEQKGLKYISQIDESLPEELFGDRIRVHQIMVNILNNAVKYTKKGSVKFTLSGAKADDPSLIVLHITVTDTGIGIHAEDIPKLFQSFSRITSKETHNIEGTGLGLAITGRLIELMGGTVEVTSTYGIGSTFHVVIPQKVVGSKTIKQYESEDSKQKKESRKVLKAPDARVLIVDDNDMNRIVLRSLMKETQIKIDEAESGEECLNKIAKNPYDVILMDYMMPHMDGKETLAKLKQMTNAPGASAKVIVCTANALVGVRAELLSAGFDDFLSKPVNGAELEEMLAKYIPPSKITQGGGVLTDVDLRN
ncbi:MAG: response regulator [Synergistaceae bacterium]|nr:response regulator [Synergistaceae bacterium]